MCVLPAVPPQGFECTLLGPSGQNSPAPLFTWRTCLSPIIIDNLPDNRYLFQARARGGPCLPCMVTDLRQLHLLSTK